MDCCLLSPEEVGQLKHYGISPSHFNHLKPKDALEKVKLGELDLVEHKGRTFVTMPRMYYLKPVKSDGVIATIQRVLSNQPSHISPA